MTRFMMTLDDAVDLVLYAFEHGGPGDIFVQKAPAATIETLAHALLGLLGRPDYPSTLSGAARRKALQTLLSREEMAGAQDLGTYYRIRPTCATSTMASTSRRASTASRWPLTTIPTTRNDWTCRGCAICCSGCPSPGPRRRAADGPVE